ncbi:mechanosensitive ion channel family protein [Labrys okinawensis]|uniref:mechanosensitive ion channel family protein n=1 Tax=Labrys okinawensis TaxID=346911 RepID=UPI0039BD1ED4
MIIRACLSLFLLLALSLTGRAAEPPPGMTKQQFEEIVSEVSDAAVRSLAQRGLVPRDPKDARVPLGSDDLVAQRAAELTKELPEVLRAVPDLPIQTVQALHRLDRSEVGARSNWEFLGLLALVSALTAAVGLVLRRTVKGLRNRIEAHSPTLTLGYVLLFAIAEILVLGLVWFTGHAWIGVLFSSADFQTVFAERVMTWIVGVGAAVCVSDIWFSPNDGRARLAPIGNEDARRLHRAIILAVALVMASRFWVAILDVPDMIQAALLVNSIFVPMLYLAISIGLRSSFGAWLAGLASSGRADEPTHHAVRLWLVVSTCLIAIFTATRVYGALSGRPEVARGTISSILALLVLLFGETLISYVVRRMASTSEADLRPARLAQFISRIARITMIFAALILLCRVWLVDISGMVSPEHWPALSRSLLKAAFVVFFAVVALEVVKVATGGDARSRAGLTPSDNDESATAATRLATIMPLFRVAMIIIIGAVAVLILLSQLGVNITPLVAGASIVGLAISFGSQTLVRDIMSGIFYLIDDAFRVGEYIDCGKAKGTVEGFTLRCIRLRHQNGQIHTIPFGQLGQITNFSRDWTTVKFNLRFVRDTDLEKLRKTVKKIGLEMMDDAELKDEIMMPLKMQGVADIIDNALVVRFKFTVRPSKPTFVQREALKRMFNAFSAAGIEFANTTVAVQSAGSGSLAVPAAALEAHRRAQLSSAEVTQTSP